jgi:hypothetical protein
MAAHEPSYFAYLLRIWRADGDDEPIWRASLQRPGGAERRGFASLEELFAYLRSQAYAGATPVPPAAERGEERSGKTT